MNLPTSAESLAMIIAENAIKSREEMDRLKITLTKELSLYYGENEAKAIVRLWVELQPRFYFPLKIYDAIREAAQHGTSSKHILIFLTKYIEP